MLRATLRGEPWETGTEMKGHRGAVWPSISEVHLLGNVSPKELGSTSGYIPLGLASRPIHLRRVGEVRSHSLSWDSAICGRWRLYPPT